MNVVSTVALAVRRLVKNPGFSVPAVMVLSLGIAAATGIFSVVNGVLLKPLPLPDSGRLVMLCESHPSIAQYCVTSIPAAEELTRESRTLAGAGLARMWHYTAEDASGSFGLDAGLATPGFLQTLGMKPVVGRLFTDEEYGPDRSRVVVLSHALWTSRFGADSSVVGRVLRLDGQPHEIVGVLPAPVAFSDLRGAETWKPMPFDPDDPDMWEWRGFTALGRLAPGATAADAQAELAPRYRALGLAHPEIAGEWRLTAVSVLDREVGGVRATLLTFLGAVAVLLLIACLNVANLFLARGSRAGHEYAVRAALGAGRLRLAGEILTEAVVLGLISAAVALLLSSWITRTLIALAPAGIPRLDGVSVDPTTYLFAVSLGLATAVVFGLVPAVRTARVDLRRAIQERDATRGSPGRRTREGLVVVELALSAVLLVGAGLLTRTFANYVHWDPGFDRDRLQVLSVFPPTEKYPTTNDLVPFYRDLESALREDPSVASVGTASSIPLVGGIETAPYFVDGQTPAPGQEPPRVRWFDVGPMLFETLGVPLVRGRGLTEEDDLEAGERPLLVNEAFVRSSWPEGDPLGHTVDLLDRGVTFRVVGVVADVRPLTPGAPTEPEVYWSNRQLPRWASLVVVRQVAGTGAGAVSRLRDRILRFEPDADVYIRGSLNSNMRRALVRPRFSMLLITVFAGAAVLLTAIGLYGVMSYTVAERRREIGIRLALGFPAAHVTAGVVRRGVTLAVVGALMGLGGAGVASAYLRSLLHGVAPWDPLTLALSGLLLLALGAAACWLPARRAARVDPVELLRAER